MSRLRFCELGVGGKIQLAIYVNNSSFFGRDGLTGPRLDAGGPIRRLFNGTGKR